MEGLTPNLRFQDSIRVVQQTIWGIGLR